MPSPNATTSCRVSEVRCVSIACIDAGCTAENAHVDTKRAA
jgi:hypothetical protein